MSPRPHTLSGRDKLYLQAHLLPPSAAVATLAVWVTWEREGGSAGGYRGGGGIYVALADGVEDWQEEKEPLLQGRKKMVRREAQGVKRDVEGTAGGLLAGRT